MSISNYISNLSQGQINIIRSLIAPIEYLIIFLDFIFPKNNKLIFFGSNTGEYASGSPKAFYDYVKSEYLDYELYYYLPFEKSTKPLKTLLYMLKSLKVFLRAGFLVASHPTSDFFPFGWSKRKQLINMWHGTPLKSLFYADKGESEVNLKKITKLNNKTSYFLASSQLEAALIAKCFLIDPRKIKCTGHPRNDVLFRNKQQIIPSKINDIPDYNKIILYCPTYRRDGSVKFFPFDDMDFDHLNSFLEEYKLVILIRGHVFDKLEKSDGSLFSKRIIDFGFDKCSNINRILPEIDILITDYSSIYIDYLNLNRHCIFIPYDLNDYLEGRGLLLDNYDFWAPGDKVGTYNEFIKSINDIIQDNDNYKDKRKEVSMQFNYYDNGNACKNSFRLINDGDG